MFSRNEKLFELKENEISFDEICQKLRNHSFQSPWALCFEEENKVEDIICEVQEFQLPELNSFKTIEDQNHKLDIFTDNTLQPIETKDGKNSINEEIFLPLKTSISCIQESNQVDDVKDINSLSMLSLAQMPALCDFLYNAFSNETAVALFLGAILSLEKTLSITVAAAIIHHIVFPKILSFKASNCRNLDLSILDFSRVYPKAVIDEILVPSLKMSSLEAPLQEMLLKLVKSNIPSEYVGYSIKNILNEALLLENTFLLLQNLVERKVPYDESMHNVMAITLENCSSTNLKNMKFTKLLICILTTYGSELTEPQIKIYSDIVKANETIMKKAAENVLKKLK